MVAVTNLKLSPAPRFSPGAKMTPEERARWESVERWAREVQDVVTTLQSAAIELQSLVTALQAALSAASKKEPAAESSYTQQMLLSGI